MKHYSAGLLRHCPDAFFKMEFFAIEGNGSLQRNKYYFRSQSPQIFSAFEAGIRQLCV